LQIITVSWPPGDSGAESKRSINMREEMWQGRRKGDLRTGIIILQSMPDVASIRSVCQRESSAAGKLHDKGLKGSFRPSVATTATNTFSCESDPANDQRGRAPVLRHRPPAPAKAAAGGFSQADCVAGERSLVATRDFVRIGPGEQGASP
jgi:hypothetical protein